MRVRVVFALLLVLFVATVARMVSRDRVAHTVAAPAPSPKGTASAAGDAGVIDGSAPASSAAGATRDGGPVKWMDRPLRAVTLGWDLAAPAVLANGGLDPAEASDFSAAGVETYVHPLEGMGAIEGALARGGGDREGADIAVVPFAELCASYERLRALRPEVFFVVGWSRGREALVSTRDALPSSAGPPGGPGVSAVAGGARAGADPFSMVGAPGEAATFLGLFALDANGIPPGAVHLVAHPDKPDVPELAAVDRDAPGESARRTVLLTTADASRLVPFVAVAQRGLLDAHGPAFVAWTRVWLEATRKLDADPPAAARAIAAAPGAPEPIALLKRLGEMAPASLGDNARAFGLSGRGALTLDALFQQTWRIWRGVGALATPAPDAAPVHDAVVAALARAYPSLTTPAASPRPRPPAPSPDTLKVLVTYRQGEGKVDEAALLATTGLLADVFERSVLRVAVLKAGSVDAAATKHLVEQVGLRFDVAPDRLVQAKKAPVKAGGAGGLGGAPPLTSGATVEILVAP